MEILCHKQILKITYEKCINALKILNNPIIKFVKKL